jgi:hypothetical protein
MYFGCKPHNLLLRYPICKGVFMKIGPLQTLGVIVFLTVAVSHGDIISPGTHRAPVCANLVNPHQYSNIVIVQALGCHGTVSLGPSEVTSDTACLAGAAWYCSNRLFWMPKAFFDTVGITGTALINAVNASFQQAKQNATAPTPVYVLSDSIQTGYITYPDSNTTQRVELSYTVLQTGSSYGAYLSKKIFTHLNGTSDTETFSPPAAHIVLGNPKGVPTRLFAVKSLAGSLSITALKALHADIALFNSEGSRIYALETSLAENANRTISVRGFHCGSYVLRIVSGQSMYSQQLFLIRN